MSGRQPPHPLPNKRKEKMYKKSFLVTKKGICFSPVRSFLLLLLLPLVGRAVVMYGRRAGENCARGETIYLWEEF